MVPNYMTSGGGIRPSYADSIPTSRQMQDYSRWNQYARSLGLRNFSELDNYQNMLKNLQLYGGRLNQPGMGQNSAGMWGPTGQPGSTNPALQQQVQARMNQLTQFYNKNPKFYQNAMSGNLNLDYRNAPGNGYYR